MTAGGAGQILRLVREGVAVVQVEVASACRWPRDSARREEEQLVR